jgi:sugar phosphate isomerase/epimerase
MDDLRFGCSTWFFQEHPVTEALGIIGEIGFPAAEIWMEHLWKRSESYGSIRNLAERLGLTLSLHAASYDLNITSANPGIRRESLRQIEESIKAAAALGAEPVVVHAGRLSSSRGDEEEYWRLLADAFDFLERIAAVTGIKVAVEAMENRSKELFVGPEDVHRLLNGKSRHLGLTVDLAHIQTVMDHEQFFSRIQDELIMHAHLSDFSPETTHVPLGHGLMDIDRALRTLHAHYRGVVVLEGFVRGAGIQTVKANWDYLHDHGWM